MKTRKAKLIRYFNGEEFIDEETNCTFHGFFQYQDINEARAIAIVELENGSVQTVDPEYLIFET